MVLFQQFQTDMAIMGVILTFSETLVYIDYLVVLIHAFLLHYTESLYFAFLYVLYLVTCLDIYTYFTV